MFRDTVEIHQCKVGRWDQQCGQWTGLVSGECKRVQQFSHQSFRHFIWQYNIFQCWHIKKYIICTDSLSSLQAIRNNNVEHRIVKKLLIQWSVYVTMYCNLIRASRHQGIGNETCRWNGSRSDYHGKYHNCTTPGWRGAGWSEEEGAGWSEEEYLGSIVAGVAAAVVAVKNYRSSLVSYNSHQQSRRWEEVMARLRFGVCVFTHQNLFNGSPRAMNEKNSATMTIHHLLIVNPEYEIQRKKCKEKI